MPKKLGKRLWDLAKISLTREEEYERMSKLANRTRLPGDDVLNYASALIALLFDRMKAEALSGSSEVLVFEHCRVAKDGSLTGIPEQMADWAKENGLNVVVDHRDPRNIRLLFTWQPMNTVEMMRLTDRHV